MRATDWEGPTVTVNKKPKRPRPKITPVATGIRGDSGISMGIRGWTGISGVTGFFGTTGLQRGRVRGRPFINAPVIQLELSVPERRGVGVTSRKLVL